MVRKLSLLFFLIAMMVLSGCDEQTAAPVAKAPQPSARIVVPDFVQGQWQAVRITVFDKGAQKGETYLVNLGADTQITGSSVHFRVDNYLPAFVVDNKTMTSLSNEPTNPAVQITIFEGDRQIYQSWLFQNFPEAHSFQHPRFNFTLVEAIKAPKKKG